MRVQLLVALVPLLAGSAAADGPEAGTLTGRAVDPQGASLPGVLVVLTGERGSRDTTTEGSGQFRFALLAPGSYRVSGVLEGFETAAMEVDIVAGERAAVVLELGLVEEERIVVVAEAPLVDKFNVTAGQTMPSEVGVQVTGENRTYYGIINFMPGVVNEDQNKDLSSTRPNINGATWADATVYIDGVDTTFSRYGGSRVFLPATATSEVTLNAGALDVEYGRTVGSATNVIVKSGTNRFRGEVMVNRTQEDWNAEYDSHPRLEERVRPVDRDFFKRTDEEKRAHDTLYESSLGGPIRRDRAWFFVSSNDQNTNKTGKTLNGDFVDESGHFESTIAKLNYQPQADHQVAFSYIETPVYRNFRFDNVFDRYAMTPIDSSGDLVSASWNWSASSRRFLETKLASQTSREHKLLAFGGLDVDEAIRIKQMDPRFPSGDPALVGPDYPGNNFRPYSDRDGWHNGWLLDNGYGTNRYPRSQVNLAVTQFVGEDHELRLGFDAQGVKWLGDVRRENAYFAGPGNVFDAQSVSGYSNAFGTNPLDAACDFTRGDFCIVQDYNHPDLLADLGSNDSESRNTAIYGRDRFTVGPKWVLNAGLRAERQVHKNDVGREIMDSLDLAPRLSVAYDLGANGRQILSGYLGRAYHQLPQQAINEYLQDHFNGYNGYERRLFLDCAFIGCLPFAPQFRFPFPLGYDLFSLGFLRPGLQWDLVDAGIWEPDLEAYHKDEVVLGYERQVGKNWVFDAKLIWWKVDNLISSTTQLAWFDGRIDAFVLTVNTGDFQDVMRRIVAAAGPVVVGASAGFEDMTFPGETFLATGEAISRYQEPERRYRGLQLQLNRRAADNWALYSNITFSEAAGSSYGDVFNNTNADYGRNLEQVMTQQDIDICQAQNPSRPVAIDCQAAWGDHLGQPMSIILRDGNASFDRGVIAKATGWKLFPLRGRHTLTLGGHGTYESGARWNRGALAGGIGRFGLLNRIPVGLSVGVPFEPEWSRSIAGIWWLNTSIAYGFPLGERTMGDLRVEIQNLTDRQKQVTGGDQAPPLRRFFQRPRRFRLLLGIRF